MRRRIVDEGGMWLRRQRARKRNAGPLSEREQAEFEAQNVRIRALFSQRPRNVLIDYDLGTACAVARERALWRRVPEHQQGTFGDFLVRIAGGGSRQGFERRMLVAAVFNRETAQECHQHGVGISVLMDVAGTYWQLRKWLLRLAMKGTSTRTLADLQRAGEAEVRRLAAQGPQEVAEIEAVMDDLYRRWESGKGQGAEDQAPDEEGLAAREAALARQEIALGDRRVVMEEHWRHAVNLYDAARAESAAAARTVERLRRAMIEAGIDVQAIWRAAGLTPEAGQAAGPGGLADGDDERKVLEEGPLAAQGEAAEALH